MKNILMAVIAAVGLAASAEPVIKDPVPCGGVKACLGVSGFTEQKGNDGAVQLWKDGPYFAKCNVGATKPEEYGYYFWWGDTVGYRRNATDDGWVSVKDGTTVIEFSADDVTAATTCGKTDAQLLSMGYIDNGGNLAETHDAARAHLGGDWRMPTDDEIQALIANTTMIWTDDWNGTGVAGEIVTGKGEYAGNSIFLPAAGYGKASGRIDGALNGDWSSTPSSAGSDEAWSLDFSSNGIARGHNRCYGLTVRAVRDTEPIGDAGIDTERIGDFKFVSSEVEGEQVRLAVQVPFKGFDDVEEFAAWVDSVKPLQIISESALPVLVKSTAWVGCGSQTVDTADPSAFDAVNKLGVILITVPYAGSSRYYKVGFGNETVGVRLWENGPYFAECNVGAAKPEECGYYFWWGDTVGYKRNATNDGWVSVKDGTTGFEFADANCPSTGKSPSQLRLAGWIDEAGGLTPEHDAAHAHLGGSWRLPTGAEMQALVDNCMSEWTMKNGVYGRLITGKGEYAGNGIFLPAVGYGLGAELRSPENFGYYWSSTPHSAEPDQASGLDFSSVVIFRSLDYRRSCGYPVRAVRDAD